jgi:hypothetical protein
MTKFIDFHINGEAHCFSELACPPRTVPQRTRYWEQDGTTIYMRSEIFVEGRRLVETVHEGTVDGDSWPWKMSGTGIHYATGQSWTWTATLFSKIGE